MEVGGGLGVNPVTVYSGALVCAAAYLVNLGIDDLREHGRVSILHWPLLARSFSGATLVQLFLLWISCNIVLVVANGGFRLWRSGRAALLKNGTLYLWNYGWLLAGVALHTAMVVVPSWVGYQVDLPASAMCALCFEQVRLLMKSYAYLREHVKGALALPPQDTDDSLGHLVYFLFAPTLVYRDSYERTPRVRFGVAVAHGAVFLLTVFTMVVAAGRGALRPFCGGEDAVLLDAWGLSGPPRLAFQLGVIVVRATPAGAVIAVGTALAMHSWHTVFAELLRYPSIGFTKPWWNAPSYTVFFRHWNMFVKAWLYTYVFKELLTRGHSSTAAKMITIVLSAFWHEYILAVSLGYIIPYCALTYVCTAAIVIPDPLGLQKNLRGNIFVLLTLSGGIASLIAFYFAESTARLHCRATSASIIVQRSESAHSKKRFADSVTSGRQNENITRTATPSNRSSGPLLGLQNYSVRINGSMLAPSGAGLHLRNRMLAWDIFVPQSLTCEQPFKNCTFL
ncbi:sterol O-acyltransferase 2-like [Thrips palmi]|uniref:Sterol O-acyltransferase 2-like n=1 Tax=Thrips palmi TaxID=161013 RepID=A0A6P8YML0_THRPL|nr:sterol O-acyltransferase 2-like [Thrips palmi]